MISIERYITADGVSPFTQWFSILRDDQAKARIRQRLDRLKQGNSGDCKAVGGGVMELRIDYGRGYRVYFGKAGQTMVLLLCGGDKRSQKGDIERAKDYFGDFKRRQR